VSRQPPRLALPAVDVSLWPPSRVARLRAHLDGLHRRFHRPPHLVRDPVSVVRAFPDKADREMAGLVAAMLAFGAMPAILRSVREVFRRLGTYPSCWEAGLLQGRLRGFRHRWLDGDDLAALLRAAIALRRDSGDLDAAMRRALCTAHTLREAAARFVEALHWREPALRRSVILPDPRRGSACKRLLLYFRWMTRRDGIDPGGWSSLSPADLVLPLDVHTFRAVRRLGLTRRRTPNFRAAEEATAVLAMVAPEDPVRYDFALAHAGAAGRRNLI